MPAHNRAMPAREEGDACNHTSVPAPIEGRCLQIQTVMPAHNTCLNKKLRSEGGRKPFMYICEYTGGLGKFVPSLASGLIAGGWENIRTKILDSPQEVRFVSGSAWGVKPFNIIKS